MWRTSIIRCLSKSTFNRSLSHFIGKMTDILPHFSQGIVIKGFGRGSKELGIPTANLDDLAIDNLPCTFKNGVYYGWAAVDNGTVQKMVMSIGWNPFYSNTKKSMEVHILSTFEQDFYGSLIKLCITGYIREEKNFPNLESLIATIQSDIKAADTNLDEAEHLNFQNHSFFSEC